MKYKKCNVCCLILENTEDNYNKNRAKIDGLQATCRKCENKRSRLWYQRNLGHAREKRKKWQDENKEKHISHVKKYLKKKKSKPDKEDHEYKKRREQIRKIKISPYESIKELDEMEIPERLKKIYEVNTHLL